MNVTEQRRVRRLTASLATAWLLPVAVLLLLSAGASVGVVPVGVAAVFAVSPLPIYLLLVLAVDRFEPEPPRLLVMAFVWGASGAMFFALFMHGFSQGLGAPAAFLEHGSAPVFEEIGKGAVVLGIYLRKRREFDGIVDGLVYAAMSGLGFATMENVLYYADAYNKGIHTLEATWLVRGLMSPFAHPFFTGFYGIGLGIARFARSGAVRLFVPLAGLFLGMLLHALWNAFSGHAFIGVYTVVMVPAFVLVIVVFLTSLVREGRVIRQHLAAEVAAGRLTEADLRELGTLRGRFAGRCRALLRGGFEAWRNRRASHHLAAELAFLRRTAGVEPEAGDAELDSTYAEQLSRLRRQTR